MEISLEKELQYYIDNQNELVSKYNGKFLVIKDCNVLGAYESQLEAMETTSKEHELGTFLIQKCESGDSSYKQTFHSRVAVY